MASLRRWQRVYVFRSPEPVRRDILGHSPTSVTDEYTHSSPEARERAMELVANFGNYGKITATAFQEAVAV